MLLRDPKGEFFKTIDKATSYVGPFNKLVPPRFAPAVAKAYLPPSSVGSQVSSHLSPQQPVREARPQSTGNHRSRGYVVVKAHSPEMLGLMSNIHVLSTTPDCLLTVPQGLHSS